LTDSLYNDVKENCVSGSDITSIEKTKNIYTVKCSNGKSYEADRIISCLPAYEIGKLLKPLSNELGVALLSVPYCKMKLSHLVYKKGLIGNSIDGFGFLIPQIERKPLLGAVINSNVFEKRAKLDETSFTVFTKTDLGHTAAAAQKELEQILEIEGKPVYEEITTWEKAIPQFEIGHSALLQRLEKFENTEEIIISGNFKSGVSVGDCVKHAKLLAEGIMD